MPNRSDDKFRHMLSQVSETTTEARAPSRLKARVYSALIREQQMSGPLESLADTQAKGRNLCVFEKLVQIAPIGDSAKAPFFCWTCHARILAERLEGAPIYWSHCPYVRFQKR